MMIFVVIIMMYLKNYVHYHLSPFSTLQWQHK